jgi:hypothetical protein
VVGGIDKVHAKLDGAMDDLDIAPLIGIAELSSERRTAVTNGGYFQSVLAKIAILHAMMLLPFE